MLRYEAESAAPPEVAWRLYAEPRNWPRWAPQLRGAWGLGDPEVRPGARGAARLLGVVPVPARILGVDPGRTWEWTVGPVTFDHLVEPRDGGGCTVAVQLRSSPPVETALSVSYGPVCALLMKNLARVAERA